METAAEVLATTRRRAGLSQRALAARAGTSAAAVHRYETGQVQPSLETLHRLVRACGDHLRIELRPGAVDPELAAEVRAARRRPPERRLDDLKALSRLARSVRRA